MLLGGLGPSALRVVGRQAGSDRDEAGVDQHDYRWSKMCTLAEFLRDFGMAESTIDATKSPARLRFVLTERGKAVLPGRKTNQHKSAKEANRGR